MTEPSNLGRHQASSSNHRYSASAHAWNPSGILPGEVYTSPDESVLSNPRDLIGSSVQTNEVVPPETGSQWPLPNMENYAPQQTLPMWRTKEEGGYCDGSSLHLLLLRTLSEGGFHLPVGDRWLQYCRAQDDHQEAVLGDHTMPGARGGTGYSLVLPSDPTAVSGPSTALRSPPSVTGGSGDRVFGSNAGSDHQEPPDDGRHKVQSAVNDGREAKRGSRDVDDNRANASLALKKPRVEGRSSASPLKVRKEKLGDRIAALQQLVAPFGKTDTASVLMEAIGYIKFLQDQVETLSVPYLRSSKSKKIAEGSSSQESGESKLDLRSKGLCLVPLSCTSYITNENIGIWPPNFSGGTFDN